MAELPTSEESARRVLEIFAHFGTRPSEGILPNNIFAIVAKRNWRMDDISDGLEWGASNGWFKEGKNNFILLTEKGFAEI